MTINLDTTIKALDGRDMMYSDTEPFTVRLAAVNALVSEHELDTNVSAIEKVRRFTLAQRIFGASGEHEFTLDELSLLNRLCGMKYPVVIAGRMNEILNK